MIAKHFITTLLFFIIFSTIKAQNQTELENLKSNFVKSENKEKYYTNLAKNIETTFKNDKKINSPQWIKSLRDAQSILFKNSSVQNGLMISLTQPVDKEIKLQRTALEIAYTLYPNYFLELISHIYKMTKDPLSFVISTHYLLRTENKNANVSFFLNDLKIRFPDYSKKEQLRGLYNELNTRISQKIETIPNLSELLQHNFMPGKTIIYSFHRKNREFPGITIIKKADGNFVKNDDKSIFYIPQLALSYSNLPGYIPNGNTPEGIYSIVGWYISPTETIGPTPNVLTRSPFEVSPKIFYHGKNQNQKWNFEEYKKLLPVSWQNYSPIYQSYFAGKSGRRLIIMHGSTDELSYFKDFPYYPLAPTRGCLSAKEIWSHQTGKCIESDQLKLINALRSTKQTKGFLVVIEIDDKQEPIKISEIEKYLK